MKKKPIFPKINRVEFIYSGNTKMFENFVSGMICDYLNSENHEEYLPQDFVDCVENSEISE